MPPTCRLPLCLLFQFTSKLIPGLRSELGFDSIGVHFDTSSGVHLRSSPQSIPDNSKIAFSLSLTTIALYKCRIGWFGSSFWSLKPRGLLSSLIQHERLSPFFMTHEQSGTNFPCELALFISFFNSCKPHEKIYEISINNANIIKPLIK